MNIPLFKTMDEAVEAAADHLPEGYRVIIAVERHGYGVYLEDEEGSDVPMDGGDGMRSDVYAAIEKAKEQADE